MAYPISPRYVSSFNQTWPYFSLLTVTSGADVTLELSLSHRKIFEFVECSLDAHLIGLIQYKEASVVLEALKLKLTWEIEMDTVLQGLSGPLAQSSQLIKQKQRRQREKLTQSHKQPLSKGQNPKPNGTNSKPSKPLHHRSSAHTAQPNGRPASNRPSKKSTPKRSVHPDARRLQAETSNAQSVAEYALERFNL
jgi:hypothetical protein